ncbi:MAG: hypothetical protein WCL22_06155, partial [bacterium]
VQKYLNVEELKKELDEAKKDRDGEKLGKILKDTAVEMSDKLKEARGASFTYLPGFYGTGDEADKRIAKAAGAGISPKKDNGTELSETGRGIVDRLEKIARLSLSVFARDKAPDKSYSLLNDLNPMMPDVEGLGSALERLHRAVDSTDGNELQEALFSFNGVKNLIHNHLRKLNNSSNRNQK